MPNDEAYTSVNPNDIEVIDTLREASGGGGAAVVVDDEMSWTSENPLQNKVITQALNDAVAGLAQDISEGLAERPTADELKPKLLYKGTIGSGAAYGGGYAHVATIDLTDEDVEDGVTIMLNATATSDLGTDETPRFLKLGAEGEPALMYDASFRAQDGVTYPWSAGANLIMTAETYENNRVWRVDGILQRASENGILGIVSLQDTADGMRARTGIAISPYGAKTYTDSAVPTTTASSAGKVLTVASNGAHTWNDPKYVPESTSADSGKVLKVNASGGAEWGAAGGGDLPSGTNVGDILYWTGSVWTVGAITNVINNGDGVSY